MRNIKFIFVLSLLIFVSCKSIDSQKNTTNNQITDQKKAIKDLVWEQVGPSVPNEDLLDKYSDATQTYWHGNGRISAIWIDPKNDDHILIGVSFGGLFETFDAGQNWHCLTDKVPVNEIHKIDVKNDVLFISSGYRFENPQRFSSDKYYGLGIIKSYNKGKTWHLPKLDFCAINFSISKFHKTIYAISVTGVYKSINNGNSYVKMADLFDENYNNKSFRSELSTVFTHPTNPNIAFVTGKRANSKHAKVFFKTINGGKTWTNETTKLLQFISKTPKNTKETFIKDAALYYNDKTEKLWLHFSAAFVYGKSTSLKKRRYKLHSYVLNSSDINNFEFYMTHVIKAGHHYSPKFYEKNDVLYLLGWYLHIKKPNESKFKNVGYGKVHQDCRDVKVDKKGTIYYANDAGICKSIDFGESWQNAFYDLNANLIFEMSYYSDAEDRFLDIGTQDTGYYRKNLNSNSPYYPIETHEGGIYTSPHYKDRIYVKDNVLKVTNDGGKNFKVLRLNNGKTIDIMHRDGLVLEDPNNENILYVSHKNSLFMSEKLGEKGTWLEITPKDLGRGADMAIPKSNSNILYYANYLVTFPIKNGGFRTYKRQNRLLKSTDKGKTWKNLTNSYFKELFKTSVISDVEVDNNNPDKVWLTTRNLGDGDNVFYSETGGNNWTNISFNLPKVPANRIEYNEKNKTLYLANDYGVYYLKDNNWIEYGKGLPKVIVNGLVIDNNYNEMIVSTFGRGAWKIDLK